MLPLRSLASKRHTRIVTVILLVKLYLLILTSTCCLYLEFYQVCTYITDLVLLALRLLREDIQVVVDFMELVKL